MKGDLLVPECRSASPKYPCLATFAQVPPVNAGSQAALPASPRGAPAPARPGICAPGSGSRVWSQSVVPQHLPACELPTSEPRAKLRKKASTCRAPQAFMTAAGGERRPAEPGPGGPWTRTSKRSHLSRQRMGEAAAGEFANCNWSPSQSPGRDGREG